jgi:formylglycine-generating enzyme required for sulfatase activity
VTSEKPFNPAHAVAEALDRIVDEAERNERASFAALVKAAGLDPAQDFIGAFLRDLDFRDEDLRGFDFSQADLTGADFRRANLSGVRFDGAILTGVIGLPPIGEKPLANFAVLSDAPFGPELVVLPTGEFMMGSTAREKDGYEDERPRRRVTIGKRFAIGRYPVTFTEYDCFCQS